MLIGDEERWKNYVGGAIIDATINKDILMDSPIGKPALLHQTFELSVAYSGKILSLTKMLGILQDAGNTVTLAGYLNLLGDSGLVTGLQKFSIDVARKRESIPKYQVYNNALLSSQLGLTFQEAVSDSKQWGQFFESAIGAYILSEAFTHRFEVIYWREGNDEVDFINDTIISNTTLNNVITIPRLLSLSAINNEVKPILVVSIESFYLAVLR